MAKATKKKQEGYFRSKELACKCGCNTIEFDLGFLATLNAIREECGFPFAISSAYRCPLHPIEARKEALGAHAYGKAVDVLCSGEKALEVIRVSQANGINRIGIKQTGGGRFIHLDVCTEEDGFPSPALWSY